MPLLDRETIWARNGANHVLFVLLLCMFPFTSFATELHWSATLVRGIYQLLFFSALIAAADTRRQLTIGALLFAPSGLGWLLVGDTSLIQLFDEALEWSALTSLSSAAFLLFLVSLMVRRLFRLPRVTWSGISAAASGFLMLGLAWSGIYAFLESSQPGSFRGLIEGQHNDELFYFSYVTLTTLGYGDIVPVSSAARMVTLLEAILGQLYLVVLVARLVSMIGPRADDSEPA
jgi:hypothetical protein